jgi:predicted solute-binding protein
MPARSSEGGEAGWISIIHRRSAGGLRAASSILLLFPVSNFCNPIYRIVDNVSISSAGPVYSVVVAHCGDISGIDEIELDPAAETSGNLLRCLLAKLNLAPRFIRSSISPITTRRARLLIGDQAIRFRQHHRDEFRFWDLGEQWNKLVDLPFVYALWLIRPEVVEAKRTASRLRKFRDENLARIDDLIGEEKDFDHDFCHRYYRENLRFSFSEKEKEGLRIFQKLCEKHDLIQKHEVNFELVCEHAAHPRDAKLITCAKGPPNNSDARLLR